MYYRKGTFRDIIGGFNRVVIKGSPQLLVLNSFAWIFLAMSCGLVGLGSGVALTFVFALGFLGWAAVEIVLALVRYNAWKKAGLTLFLPDGTAFRRVDHVFYASSGSQSVPQIVTFSPPTTGDTQEVVVACATCQQELVFRVVSQKRRKAQRLRAAGIAVLCLLVGLGLNIVSSQLMRTQALADWGFLGGLVLIFGSLIVLARMLNDNGVRLVKAPTSAGILHKARLPEKADFEQFRRQTGTVMGMPTRQNATYQQG